MRAAGAAAAVGSGTLQWAAKGGQVGRRGMCFETSTASVEAAARLSESPPSLSLSVFHSGRRCPALAPPWPSLPLPHPSPWFHDLRPCLLLRRARGRGSLPLALARPAPAAGALGGSTRVLCPSVPWGEGAGEGHPRPSPSRPLTSPPSSLSISPPFTSRQQAAREVRTRRARVLLTERAAVCVRF